jgi:C-terminal processing protease CtpA/Prc
MKAFFTLIVSVLFLQNAIGQSKIESLIKEKNIEENEKIVTTIKIWGFLKYYHPQVAKGTYNWDEKLTAILPIVHNANSKEALSQVYINWIKSLGPIKECKSCQKESKKEYLDKNFDLNWTQNTNLFNTELTKVLKNIEENRYQGKPYYVKKNSVGGIILTNEPEYKELDFTKKELRIITLARYWNTIEYFFPYKYLTDKKWDVVLTEMLPQFLNINKEEDFHLAMLELVVSINDTHSMFITPITNNYFGLKWIPADYKMFNDKVIITNLYNDSLAQKSDIQIGDIITKVNGISITEQFSKNKKYINASNESVRERNSNYCLFNGNTETVNVEVERNGVIYQKTYNRYYFKNFNYKPKEKQKWKLLENNIGYVNMGDLTSKDVEQMMEEFKNTKSIIFDIRNYPKGTIYYISRYISPKKTSFVKISNPDLSYPGKFFWDEDLYCGNDNKEKYLGKVIIIVNEETQSHAEFTAMALQTAPNAITIGSQTAAADGNISEVSLAGGFRSIMTGIGIYYPNKSETQRTGIKIDIKTKPTIEGIKLGKDEVLERAVEIAQ